MLNVTEITCYHSTLLMHSKHFKKSCPKNNFGGFKASVTSTHKYSKLLGDRGAQFLALYQSFDSLSLQTTMRRLPLQKQK